jgi:hypothetical protein
MPAATILCISIRNTSMNERPPTRHGRAAHEKALRQDWSIKHERDLAEEHEIDDEERTELDTRRKQRSRGKEPLLPQSVPWWDGIDREQLAILSSPELLHGLLVFDLEAEGVTLEAALATMSRGRIPIEERELHDLLVRAVAALHEHGAKLTDIAAAIGRDRKTLEQLVSQGHKQRDACKRHATFQSDCPACLRHAPDRATPYSGPEDLRGKLVGGSS